MKEFNVENWNRKSQYEYFKNYEDPFFNITANIEVSKLLSYCKQHNLSFSLACLYIVTKAINEITEFKLRIKNGKVYVCDTVHIGSTILNEDNSFSFCYFNYQTSIFEFDKVGKIVIENHKKGVKFESNDKDLSIIHGSTVPWISFTGIKHARKGNERDTGIPKIVFGKYFDKNGVTKIPFSIEAHHALADGYHVALLFDKMRQYILELK